MRRVLLALLVASCTAPVKPSTPAVVQGTVTCTSCGAITLQVHLSGSVTELATADDAGHYTFTGVPAGHYIVAASADSTQEGEVDAAVDVVAGTLTQAPALVLTAAGSVSGRITIAQQTTGNGGIAVTLDGTDVAVTTDDSGAFSMPRVAIGPYRLRAQKVNVGGRTLKGITVTYAHDSAIGTLDITPGISAEFNHPPEFSVTQITMTPYSAQPGSSTQPLPLSLPAGEVARFDTVRLSAPSTDADGDAITYFWTVTAGTLDRTDQDTVSWTVDTLTAASATVAVRIVDERSASNQLTTQVDIVDVQALSADLGDSDVVYAYRVFSGDFHVLQLALATNTVHELAEVASLSDPTPQHVGAYIHLVTDADGSPHHLFFLPGDTPIERTPGGNERGVSAGGLLVQSQGSGTTVGWGYDPASDSAHQLFACNNGGCGAVAGARGTLAAFITRDALSTINLFDVASGVLLSGTATSDVGDTLLVDTHSVLYSDAAPNSGRIVRNVVEQLSLSSGGSSVSPLYSGLYDVFLGGFDGDLFGFTEQQYREVYAPETAYLYRRSTNAKSPVDAPDIVANVFAYDRVLGIDNGTVVLRRYTRMDWLKQPNQTHYQLVREAAP